LHGKKCILLESLRALSASDTASGQSEPYAFQDGVFRPFPVIQHRDEEYDSRGFELLHRMQQVHFWYRGRHRFLLHALRRNVRKHFRDLNSLRAVDLGGGCGGWIDYVLRHDGPAFKELALADSSLLALQFAREFLPGSVRSYQIDLLKLGWEERWDVAFLLDVLEHIPEDGKALQEIGKALAPGGLLFITTPALRCFWTWNDEVAKHRRRYSKADFRILAAACGLRLLDVRYFMFILSPLLLAQRLFIRPPVSSLKPEQAYELVQRTHRVPPRSVNSALGTLFACETPVGHYFPFPWGTSVMAVLQRPAKCAS
jgi:SAM-dependent methyltransferase